MAKVCPPEAGVSLQRSDKEVDDCDPAIDPAVRVRLRMVPIRRLPPLRGLERKL
jgi:hypothetical protein